MDMRLHWMRDRINQDNYIVYWNQNKKTKRTTIPSTTHQPIIGMSYTTTYINKTLPLTKLTTWSVCEVY